MRPDLFVCCLETRFLRDWARCEAFWRKVQQKICGLLPGLLPQPPCSAEWQGRRRTHQCKGSSSMSCFVFLPLTSKKIPWQINLGEAKMIPFCHEQQWDPDRLGQSHCRICLPWYFGVPKTCLGTGSVLTCLSLPETETAGKTCGSGAQGMENVCLPNSPSLWKSCW